MRVITLLVALVLASGCGAMSSRNDPDDRGAFVLGTELAFVDASAFVRGEGRIWVRLMQEKGGALERELPWVLERAAGERMAEGPRPVTFRHDRSGLPPAIALFDDLPAGAYRVSSFLVSASLERRDGSTTLASLSGELAGLAMVRIAPGEIADLGLLTVSLTPSNHFDYRAARDGKDRAGPVQALRRDLAGFQRVERTIPSSGDGAAGGDLARATGARGDHGGSNAAGGNAAGGGAAGGGAVRGDAAGGGAPAGAAGPGGPGAPVSGGGEASAGAGPEGRTRPRGIGGEPRGAPEGPRPVDPGQGGPPSTAAVIAAIAADRSALEVGLSLAVGEAFADAEGGAGVIRIELRRVGRSADLVAIEAGFDLGSPPTTTARRAVTLIAAGAARMGSALVVPVRLEPGEWEVSAIRASGSFTRAGADRRIVAEAETSRFATVRVLAGELADIGALTLDLASRDRLIVRYDPRGSDERLAALRDAGASGPGTRPDPILRGLRPVVRPLATGGVR